MSKTIGFTYDLKSDWNPSSNDPSDVNAEFDNPRTIEEITQALKKAGHQVISIGNINKLLECINDLNVDLMFNICEGRSGRNRESQVPTLLEMHDIPFVGSDALTMGLTLDKLMAKKCFFAEGVPTPQCFVAHEGDNLIELNTIGFPLIVKTRYEGSSKGIHENARVENLEELRERVAAIHEIYNQPALVEEFIAGTEFTVAVLGNRNPEAMPIVQVQIDGSLELGDQFYNNAFIYSDRLQYVCPAQISDEQTAHIQNLAVRAFKAVDCRDVGRVDFRMDEEGQPYVLEINPLPNFGKEDVFNIFPQVIGSNYDDMVARVVDIALERNGLLSEGALT